MFAREVVPSSTMSGLQIYPPLFDENEKYRSFTAQLDIDITVQELSPKQVSKDADGIFKLHLGDVQDDHVVILLVKIVIISVASTK